MAGQDVQNNACRMDIVRQCLKTSGFYGLQTIGQDGTQDIHHLPVAAGLAFQFALNAPQGNGQIPFLEWRAIAQSTGFTG